MAAGDTWRAPSAFCEECGKPAKMVCVQCGVLRPEGGGMVHYCAPCAKVAHNISVMRGHAVYTRDRAEEIVQRADELQLPALVVEACMRYHDGQELHDEYKRFIALKMLFGDQTLPLKLSPPPRIAEVWRAHLLHNVHYNEWCLDAVGWVVPHDPAATRDPEPEQLERTLRAKRCYRLVYETEPVHTAWECHGPGMVRQEPGRNAILVYPGREGGGDPRTPPRRSRPASPDTARSPSPSHAAPIPVVVKMHTGKCLTVEVRPGDTVRRVMDAVEARERVPVSDQRLVYNGEHLYPGRPLHEYGIRRNAVLHLSLHLRSW
eukprot:TRINITY_DN10729_c0_g1_i2.p2 TRINITY_DN10729_c0_g1~~TRINITY_DN10729_c0_g1_i2.p2  ORF type:complete len:343 (+),score=120.00 TRINITY_DN10729_c0_g1_i2:73-1029(+)